MRVVLYHGAGAITRPSPSIAAHQDSDELAMTLIGNFRMMHRVSPAGRD